MRRCSDATGRSPSGRPLPFRMMAIGGTLCLAVSVAACETTDDGAGPSEQMVSTAASADSPMIDPAGPIGASPLPRVSVGDTYVFDSPRERWTVESVGDDRVVWESDQGGRRVTSNDPLMPSMESSAPGVGQVTRIVQSQTGSLWPLKVGNESSFVVAVGMERPPYSQSLAWNCRVVGVSRVDVPAGTFNTQKVACARSDGLRLNTYYAPTVGYFVKREVTTADNQQGTRSLVAFDNAASAAASPAMAGGPAPETAPPAPVETTPLAPPPGAAPAAPPPAAAPAATPAPTPAANPAANPMPQPAPAPQPAAASAPAPAPAGAWTGSGVRLGSYRTEGAARTGWTKFQAAYPALLGRLSPRIEPVTLEGKGQYHRIYAGPFASAAEARSLCGKIEEMGSVCDIRTFN